MRRSAILTLFILTIAAAPCLAEVTVETILDDLNNPSSVSFSPKGELTVCDADGKVIVVKDGKAHDYITGFDTEHWKKDDTGKNWYKLGPLSAIWVGEKLAVTDAGKPDGKETVLMFDGPGKASDGVATNSVGPTTDDAKDNGEGNLCGLSATKNGNRIFVAGQGFDGKTWVLDVLVQRKRMRPLLSADENGIETNSPMQTMPFGKSKLLVLYSGKGGAADGLLVEWDLKTKKPSRQWKLPGVVNPMGMARLGKNKLAVVENNWSLTEVNEGRVVVAVLGDDGGDAKVKDTGVKLLGPVACTVGPDKRLYVAQLGKQFDKNMGSVVALSGVK